MTLLLAGWLYIEIVNWNTHMNFRQKFLKTMYPAIIAWGKLTGKRGASIPTANAKTAGEIPFHSLSTQLNNGQQLDFNSLKGKKVMLVNTASDCGFTAQYDDLQKLYEQYKDKLVIIGFPANDFKEQEKGSDADIAEFCRINFGVTFPLAKKSSVVNGPQQNRIFQWLTNEKQNGWNNQQPSWNFSKYLVNEEGVLTNYFDPAISPMSEQVLTAVKQ